MDIRFHFSMIFSVLITYFIFRPIDFRSMVLALLWLIGFISCILLHELGHALAAKLAGVEVKSIIIWLLGGLTNLERKPEKPLHNLAISAAGPLVNLFLGFVFVAVYILLYVFAPRGLEPELFIWVQTFIELSFSLALLNIILVVFNLLPIYPLDGGNIMHAVLDGLFGRSNADLITMLVSIPVLLGLIAFGLRTHDYLLLASCVDRAGDRYIESFGSALDQFGCELFIQTLWLLLPARGLRTRRTVIYS
ncbi:M50 family metallopeptidase [Candidatus Villigracilis affinis]|uniref:M50 family metallopeptidase n=1 Tax=Candidatus Villigracilis affinis TaxID=3140682 RepID=UPI002A1BA040|nr:M50 family metallopeptidase [Anaerolineales bacterium]